MFSLRVCLVIIIIVIIVIIIVVIIIIIIIIRTDILPPDVHKRCQISGSLPRREDPALLSNRFGALMIIFFSSTKSQKL